MKIQLEKKSGLLRTCISCNFCSWASDIVIMVASAFAGEDAPSPLLDSKTSHLFVQLHGRGKFLLHGSHPSSRSLSWLPEVAPRPADDGRAPTLRGDAPPAMSRSTAGTAGCKNLLRRPRAYPRTRTALAAPASGTTNSTELLACCPCSCPHATAPACKACAFARIAACS